MDTKKFLIGTIAGAVTTFIAGYLIFGLALHGYMAENTSADMSKEPPNFLWIVIGHLFFAGLLAYIFLKWAGISTLAGGLKAGLIIGLFISIAYDTFSFGATNMFTGGLTVIIVDIIGSTILWAIGGATVGWILGMSNKS